MGAGDSRRELAREILQADDVRIHRLGLLERWILPALILGLFGWGGVELMRSGDLTGWLLGIGFIVASSAVAYVMTFRLLLAYTDEWVLVRNVRSRIIRRVDLVGAEPTYEGLVLRTVQGKRLTAVAVQQYNAALIFGRVSKAKRIAQALLGEPVV